MQEEVSSVIFHVGGEELIRNYLNFIINILLLLIIIILSSSGVLLRTLPGDTSVCSSDVLLAAWKLSGLGVKSFD